MTLDKTSTTTSVVHTPDNNKANALSNHDTTKQSTKKAGNASSQMQLLSLARQFVIDGALIQPDKQVSIEERAIKRERINHLRKQQNIENIIQKALQYCSDSEVTDRADKDWFNSFIELAEDVSNKTMQDLWAKILAGEITSPGSFSLKSLKAFRTMSINEAKLLAKACSLAVKDHGKRNIRIISGASQTPGLLNFLSKNRVHRINLASFGLSYTELLVLADNHLVFIQESETAPLIKNEVIPFSYNGINLTVTAKKNDCLFSFYKFTPIGAELAQLIVDQPDNKYLTTLKQEFSSLFVIS